MFLFTVAACAQTTPTVQHFGTTGLQGTLTGTVTLRATTPGTVGQVLVLTQGASNQDFNLVPGSDRCTGAAVDVVAPCTVSVAFTPKAPGRRAGAVVLVQGTTVLAEQLIDGIATGPLAVIQPGHATRVAGDATQPEYVSGEDGQPATSGHVYLPRGVVATPAGDFYIADTLNNRIRHVDTSGNISTYAGIGLPSYANDGGTATAAGVSLPAQLALDGAGNLYIADTGNSAIRKVDPVTGKMTTVPGLGPTVLNAPYGVAVDKDGNLYVADTGNNVVRKWDASTGVVSIVAGTGTAGHANDGGAATSAQLNQPYGLAFGPDDLLYIADKLNQAIRRLNADGTLTTVAGSLGSTPETAVEGDGGPALSAKLNSPTSVAVDAAGNIYIADSQHNRVRRVKNGTMETIAGAANVDITTTNDTLLNADTVSLSTPYAIALDGQNDLYIADDFNKRVLMVYGNRSQLRFQDMKVGKTSSPQLLHIENDGYGTGTLAPSNFAFDQSGLATNADPNSPDCSTTATVAVGQNCALGVEFMPTTITDAAGNDPTGTLTVTSNGSNSPDVVTMSALVLSVEPTQVALSASPSSTPAPNYTIGLGSNVTFTAVVKETTGSSVPTGTVTFFDGTTPLGPAVALSGPTATLNTSSLTVGAHTIVAKYSGDDNNAASQASITETVLQNTVITVTSSLNPAAVTQQVTFTATVKPQNASGTPITSGTVTFYDGTNVLAADVNVNGSGVATFSTSTLTGGTHSITAKYSGDTNDETSTSEVLSQVVTKAGSTTMVSANPSSITVGNNITFTATVVSQGGPAPTGTVTFSNGSTALGSAPVDSSGHATYSTTQLAPTSASITAAYSGDDYTNTSSSTPALVVAVNKLATVTTLSSDGTPSNAGSAVRLTATVSMAGGQTAVGAISGTVTFYDGNNSLGDPVTLTNGTAVLSTTALTVGAHSLTAKYNGNTNYDVSTSPPFSQTVATSSSTTSLSVSTSSGIAGEPVTMTATVNTGGTVKATGKVTFTDGATVLDTVTLNAQAVATLTLKTLGPGPHSIVATYNGDTNYSGSASSASTVTIRLGTTTVTLSSSVTTAVYGSSVTFTSKLTSDGVLPANPSITLLDNGSPLTTQTVNSSGTITYTTTNLSVGTHNVTAQYAGDTNNSAAQSPVVVVTIDAAKTSTTLTSSNPSAYLGDNVTFTAAVTSSASGISGNVTFQDGSTVIGVAPVNASGIATISLSNLTVGQHSITAVYAGDTIHATSTSAPLIQTISLQTRVGISSSVNPAVAGLPVTLTASVAGASGSSTAHPTGVITFRDGTTTLGTGTLDGNGTATLTTSSLTVGTHSITASYTGDATFAAGTSAALTEVVRSALTQTSLTTSGTPSHYGNPVTFTAKVTGDGATPAGNVTFNDGTASLGQAVLANGTASITVSTLTPGVHAITASYTGNANNGTSVSAPLNQQVLQSTQITLVSSANPALTLQTPVLTATVKSALQPAPTGTVRFLEGTQLIGSATLDATGTASVTAPAFPAGTHALTAIYVGDTANDTVTSQPLNLVVNLRPTTVALSSTAAIPGTNGVFSLVAAVRGDGPVAPTGIVTFMSGGTVIGTSRIDAGGIGTLSVSQSAFDGKSVSASYGGDSNYSGSTSQEIQLPANNATNFTLTLTPTSLTIPTKQYGVTYLTIQSLGGYSDTLSLGCLGLPYAATCTFDKDSVGLPADGQVKVKVIVDTGSPLTAGGEAASNSSPATKGALLAMLPAGALLLCFLRGRRKVPALLLLLLLMALLPTGGCGTLQVNGTPPGSYTIQVSASSPSGVTLSLPVSLTVTK